MIHAFRLGPFTGPSGQSYAYAAVGRGGTLEVRLALGDSKGLTALRDAFPGQPLACEPSLAEPAKPLRLVVAPLPPEAIQARAQLAVVLASGMDHAVARPEAIAAFLTAAGAFWASRAWELVAPDEPLHVAFEVGHNLVRGALCVDSSDRAQPRLLLCDDAETLERLEATTGPERIERLTQGAGLTATLSQSPAWAAAAIEEGVGLVRVPKVERRRGGQVVPAATQDLLMATAILSAVVAFSELAEGTEAEAEVEAGPLRMKMRIGASPPEMASAAAPPAPVKAEPEEPPLSAEELAAIVKGGDEKLSAPAPAAPEPPVPTTAEPEEPPLSAEELAAIMKGGDAPEPAASPAAEGDRELSTDELSALLKGVDAPKGPPPTAAVAAPAAPAAAEEEDQPLSPEELAALLKGPPAKPAEAAPVEPPPEKEADPPPGPAPAAVIATAIEEAFFDADAPPVAPAPAPAAAVPVARIAPPAATPPEAAATEAKEAAPPELGEGWLSRAWHALGRGPKPVAPASKPVAKPAVKPVAKPAATSASKVPPRPARAAPPPELPPDPAVPFSAFARALKIAVPVEPPPVTQPEQQQVSALMAQLVTGATERERFVSFPAVALQVIELVHGKDADARGVAGFISRDPGLAADVVAVANSAAFRGVSEVGSVRDAVARLGLQEVGRVASAVSARALLIPSQPGGAASSTRLFTRAVAVATAASATALRLPGAHSDQVWLAGLLHDVGFALGATALQRLEAAGTPAAVGPTAARALEQAHAEIGAAAIKAWGLPDYLARVCGQHHLDQLPAGPEDVDLHLVRLTSALTRVEETAAGARAAEEIMQSAKALRFDVHAVRALAADLRAAEARAAMLVR